jgi:protein-L-isoaspartate(D-aspartate) O-methyltransferase
MNLEAALKVVDRDTYVLQENGYPITQSTATHAIENSLQLLKLQEGHRVLEIGTGSGFSTALIAQMVGATGRVVTIDIDPVITKRAEQLFQTHHFNQIKAVTKDGRQGFAEEQPFDRIVAWTTADYLPNSWSEQLNEEGIIVAPFQVLAIANSTVIPRFRKEKGLFVGDLVLEGSYIPMNDNPCYKTFGAELNADVMDESGSTWASSKGLKISNESEKQDYLSELKELVPQSSMFKETEDPYDFRAYWLSLHETGQTTAFREDTDQLIGFSDENGSAFVSLFNRITLFSNLKVKEKLEKWIEEWRRLGNPSYSDLYPFLEDHLVRVKIKA